MIGRIQRGTAARLSAVACLLMLVPAVSSLTPPPRPVYVTASFTDPRGFFIENLERGEVEVFEDGQPRTVELLARNEVTAVYGLLLDRGVMPEGPDIYRRGSFRSASPSTTLKEVAYGLIDKELGRQYLWVAAFEQEFQMLRDISADGATAKSAVQLLTGRRNPEESFLYSGIVAAVQLMNRRSERRRVLLLLTGLIDRKSSSRIKALGNLLASTNVELFVISSASRFQPPGASPYNLSEALLRELVDSTAGEAFFPRPGEEHLDDVTRRVLGRIVSFYTIGFESTGTLDKPAKLLIRCTRPGSKVRHHPVSPVLE